MITELKPVKYYVEELQCYSLDALNRARDDYLARGFVVVTKNDNLLTMRVAKEWSDREKELEGIIGPRQTFESIAIPIPPASQKSQRKE